MPRTAAARLGVVHPASTSRIERASAELLALRKNIAELEAKKKALSDRILLMVEQEGEADDEGKVRYETDAHKFIVINGRNVTINEKKLRKAMTSAGLTPKIVEKCIKPAMSVAEYKYVGVYERKDETEEERA